MLDVNNWPASLYTPDEAASFLTGEIRGRYPVLFDIMRQSGAPVAQIARELAKREAMGVFYQAHVYFLDPATGCLMNNPPNGSHVVQHGPANNFG
jgi:hypothetical protein